MQTEHDKHIENELRALVEHGRSRDLGPGEYPMLLAVAIGMMVGANAKNPQDAELALATLTAAMRRAAGVPKPTRH